MKFALMVNDGPYTSHGSASAWHFAVAALAQGHSVARVFFYGDGVYNALRDINPPGDEPQFLQQWHELALNHDVDLVLCSAAAERRGVLSQTEDDSYAGVAAGFRVAGLGLWMEACLTADRVVVFHG